MKKELFDYIKSPKDFERFCNLFLKKEVSSFVTVYGAGGRDKGIDAEFNGSYTDRNENEKSGRWIFQYKYFDPTKDKNQARRSLIRAMEGTKTKKGELGKANDAKCDHYVLMTNTLLTAGNIAKIEDAKNEKGYTFSLTCWDAENLITMIDEFPYILNSFRDPHLPVFLPWQDMFRDQIDLKYRLLRYDYETFGRENEMERFQTFVQDPDKKLLIVYGSGGIGKTKLAIEFAKTVEEEYRDYEPLFVQMTGESFENALGDIPPNRNYIFFIDDAHEFMDDFRSLMAVLNSQGYRESKVVILTRKPYKEVVKSEFLPVLPDGTVDELEVKKLSLEETEVFIQTYTKDPKPVGTRLAKLAAYGKDTPLIAVMVIDLFNEGTDLSDLVKNISIETVFGSYLKDIFNKHLPNPSRRYRKLLNWISAIGPIDAEDNQICKKLADILGVELYEIKQHLDDLVNYGLLIQIGRKLRVFPDSLSDYILRDACFLPDGTPSTFHETLLEKFLSLSPINLIKNLARVEDIAGETTLLDEYVAHLKPRALTGNNAVRMLILLHMEGVCYFRPDDAIEIFNIIIDNPNEKDTEVEYEFFGKFTQTHQSLVEKIVKQAHKTFYTLSGFSKTLEVIRKLFLMTDIMFSSINSPEATLKEMVRFEINKPFTFQNKALEVFETWQKEDNPKLSLVLLEALDSLLVLDFHEVFSKGNSFQSNWYSLSYSPDLIQLRAKAIELIERCLTTSQHSIVKVKTIECIRNALSPLRGPQRNNPERMKKSEMAQLQKEQARLFEILANHIQEESDLNVLNVIDSCLHGYSECSDQYLGKKAVELISKFREHEDYELYLLYRQFFGQFQGWESIEKIPSFVKSYVSKYSPDQFAQLMRECINTAEKVRGYGAAYPLWEIGLENIGELDPTYGKELLNHIFAWEIDTSYYASRLLIGIRYSDEDKAREVTQFLLDQDDTFAKRIIAGSYLDIREALQFDPEDLQILSELSQTPDPYLRYYIAACLPNFYNIDTDMVLDILVRLSTDESPWVCKVIINALINEKLNFLIQTHLDTYKQVMENCLHLETLDYESEVVLQRIFNSDPIWVIAFFEKRIAYQEKEFERNITNYEAIPILLHYLFKDVDWNDKNVIDALRRVRDWGLGPPSRRKLLAPGLLASMVDGNSSQIEGTKINDAVQTILEEWIDSEDSEKMWWTACLLRNFDEDKVFYSLVESLLIKSKGDAKVATEIEASIGTVGAYSGTLGEPLPHLEKRIEDLKALQNKTEFPIVKQFADRFIDRTRQEIKRELQRDEEILEGEE